MRIRLHGFVVLLTSATLGCAAPSPASTTCTPESEPTPASEDPVHTRYVQALDIARYPTPDRAVDTLLVLEPGNAALTWDAAGRLLVTTWTKTQYFAAPEYTAGYEFALYGETWFTTGTQVHDVCSASGKTGEDLDLRLEQLLGLPPGGSSDAFLQVWVDPEALFRPCADPSVTTTTCPVAAPITSKAPDQVAWDCAAPANAHAQWMCSSWTIRYGNSDPLGQYPWTALGYTYDWSPDNATGVGASEFVANAKTQVVFERLVPTEQFCAATK